MIKWVNIIVFLFDFEGKGLREHPIKVDSLYREHPIKVGSSYWEHRIKVGSLCQEHPIKVGSSY